MANYYTDHPEIEFHLNHPLMKRVVDLKERNYVEKTSLKMLLSTTRMPSRTTSDCWILPAM